MFLLLSGALASANFTLGILAGGLISILNFYGLCQGLQTAFGQLGNGNAGKAGMMFKYLLRLAITGLILYLVLAKTKTDIFGLVIGLAVVVISIIFSVILTFFDKSYLEEV
ncbi:MAG: ATP synthase subunit I [Deltaproteobacteria bacterium]|nr:ATP synthase subunit I [Deltaproteobacteria bacterium]